MSPAARTAAAMIFAATYTVISLQKIRFANLDRPSAALLGALLMILFGVLKLGQAYEGINWDTILLLLGMMIVVAYLRLARFFEYVSTWILLVAKTPGRLLVLLVFASGLLSALFVNDTICVLFTPIVLEAVLRARLNPVPYLIALVTSANIGSVMTLTGNPQNMLVGSFSGIPYGKFFLVLLPVALSGLLLEIVILRLLYRHEFQGRFAAEGLVLPRIHRAVVARIFGILALMLAGFLLPPGNWFPSIGAKEKLPFVAALGAVLVILAGRYKPARAFAHVDWGLLVFFSGLFVVIRGVDQAGLLSDFHDRLKPLFGTGELRQAGVLTVFTVAGSNLVSNVPFVLLAQKWIGTDAFSWYLVAMASTFAGNLTVVGSVANMIVLELSKDRAALGFWSYLRAGVPITIATTAAGFGILWAFHVLGWA